MVMPFPPRRLLLRESEAGPLARRVPLLLSPLPVPCQPQREAVMVVAVEKGVRRERLQQRRGGAEKGLERQQQQEQVIEEEEELVGEEETEAGRGAGVGRTVAPGREGGGSSRGTWRRRG